MRDVCAEVEIDAPAQRVWDVLTDTASYPEWNPLIRRWEGAMTVGSRPDLDLRLGRRRLHVRPLITEFDPPHEIRWLVSQLIRGVYDIDRRLRVEPTGEGSCRFVQLERGGGALGGLMSRLLGADVRAALRDLGQAVKSRAEAAPYASAGPTLVTSMEGTAMRRTEGRTRVGPPAWKRRITSHETFSHDSIESLGYDWERVANPGIAPKFPFKVYLPQTTQDLVEAVQECKNLGQRLTIRSKGHSSNDLVLTDGGCLLLTQRLDRILTIDEEGLTATVQAGAVSAEVDDELAQRGLGLPIIGDHNHITVGGFASVGGISPASHRFGLFVDTVQALEYVTWDGELRSCSREEDTDELLAVLAGLGRLGVIATVTVRVIQVDKHGTVLKNTQRHYYDVDEFITGTAHAIRNPGEALMERGVWADLPMGRGRTFGIGQFSAYHPTRQTAYARQRDRLAYNTLHGIGYVAGRLPKKADRALKTIGMGGVMFSPIYATMKNVEFFTDKILDSTAGDPTRMLIALAPLDRYEDLFRACWTLLEDFRRDQDCFTFISVYVKSITSPYLAQGRENQSFCELMFYCGMGTGGMDPAVLDELVERFDDICIEHQGFRYMHTKTSKDPARRDKVDPNVHYARRIARVVDTTDAKEAVDAS